MFSSWQPHLCFSTLWSISPLSRFSAGWKVSVRSPWLAGLEDCSALSPRKTRQVRDQSAGSPTPDVTAGLSGVSPQLTHHQHPLPRPTSESQPRTERRTLWGHLPQQLTHTRRWTDASSQGYFHQSVILTSGGKIILSFMKLWYNRMLLLLVNILIWKRKTHQRER